jgi:hypothetical protein
MKRNLLHAYDHPLLPNQKTVATVCNARVITRNAINVGSIAFRIGNLTCVGCKAVLIERQKEMDRDSTKNV